MESWTVGPRTTRSSRQEPGSHLRLVDQPVVDGIQRQLEAVGHAELVEDVCANWFF